MEDFQSEVKTLLNVSHPNVVAIFDGGSTTLDGMTVPYYVMELVRDAQDVLEFAKHIESTDVLLNVIEQLLEGIVGIHAKSLIHMDLKPENILICPDGPTVKITDLGFARRLRPGGDYVLVKGTSEYVPIHELRDKMIRVKAHLPKNMVAGFIRRKDLKVSWDLHTLGITLGKIANRVLENRALPRTTREQCDALNGFGRRLQEKHFATAREALDWFLRNFRGQPPFQEARHFPSHLIRIPDLLNAPLSERVRQILNDPWFQRLRKIRQLSFVHLVYPGATHTRFEHSLGAFHKAIKYLLALWENSDDFRRNSRTSELEATILAALTHDVGHYPFAHVVEELQGLPKDVIPHVDLSRAVIQDDRQIADLLRSVGAAGRPFVEGGHLTLAKRLREEWGTETVNLAASLIRPTAEEKSNLTPVQQVLSQVLSGPIDCDKLDYLQRDALHTSCPYPGGIDEDRLLTALQMLQTGDNSYTLGITHKARSAVELLVFARYIMFTEVYWHHAVRIAMRMFKEALGQVVKELPKSNKSTFYGKLLTWGDEELLFWIEERARGPALDLIRGVRNRRLYKRLLTLSAFAVSANFYRSFLRAARKEPGATRQIELRIATSLRKKYGALQDHHILVDVPSPRHGDELDGILMQEAESSRPINLLERDSVLRLFGRDFILNAKKIRVLVHPKAAHLKELGPRYLTSVIREAIATT